MEETNDELLTVPEVAAFLKVPVSWVYEKSRLKAIPVRKVGRHVRVSRRDLEAWTKEGDAEERRALEMVNGN